MFVAAKPLVAFALAIATILNTDSFISLELGNGNVGFENPLPFQGNKLVNPRLLGSGGGGAVFALWSSAKGSDVAVKISWRKSAASVRNECQILQYMETKNVEGVEKCLGDIIYNDDQGRVMVVLEPVVQESTSSIIELPAELQEIAVRGIVKTMVHMLAANVATTDVQPLISLRTGEVTLIDMTEAKVLADPPSFLDLALVGSFCSEVANQIPESMTNFSSEVLQSEFEGLKERNIVLSDSVMNVVVGCFLRTEN